VTTSETQVLSEGTQVDVVAATVTTVTAGMYEFGTEYTVTSVETIV